MNGLPAPESPHQPAAGSSVLEWLHHSIKGLVWLSLGVVDIGVSTEEAVEFEGLISSATVCIVNVGYIQLNGAPYHFHVISSVQLSRKPSCVALDLVQPSISRAQAQARVLLNQYFDSADAFLRKASVCVLPQ